MLVRNSAKSMKWILSSVILLLLIFQISAAAGRSSVDWLNHIDELQQKYAEKTGIYILEKGEDALISRAWLADNAKRTIDVQYFIWSSDNIGTLAAASLLRAAQRNVHIRVIIDDLLLDAPNEALFALAAHPNIDIRIYNPNINVGTSMLGKLINATVDFRGINQRMHNKVFIVDQHAVITGGRNMADEYFDFDHAYNFRDRDVLLFGEAVRSVTASFSDYWESELVIPIEQLIDNPFLTYHESTAFENWEDSEVDSRPPDRLHSEQLEKEKILEVYRYLKDYESDESNFDTEMRSKIRDLDNQFHSITQNMSWVSARFISDMPGKNDSFFSLGGGSRLTDSLVEAVNSANESITIQSPYLVMSWDAWKLLSNAVKRGVTVRISTNSLSSTDNLPAYSGYARQRNRLLNSGFDIYEFKPDAKIRADIINRYPKIKHKDPIFALHAKSMVIDGKTGFIGSFNFDPRSENLNTETGIFFEDEQLARQLEEAIEVDMHPDNSWNVKEDGHSHDTSIYKRTKVFFLKLLPMDAIL